VEVEVDAQLDDVADAAGGSGGVSGSDTAAADDLAAVREVVLRAYPDAVPELVGGGSVAEVLASVEAARAAYRRIAEAVGGAAGAAAEAAGAASGPSAAHVPSVPAGAVSRPAADPERLPAAEKIRRGLAAARRE
jgi:hypothetical protein